MEEKDKVTPVFDWDEGDFVVDMAGQVATAAGPSAVPHILAKAQQTARGKYAVYADLENADLNHKYGSDVYDILSRKDLDEQTRISELKRAIRDAIEYDPWVKSVTAITITQTTGDTYTAEYEVLTIFDTIEVKGAVLNG